MVGQLLEPAQVAQHHFQSDVVADGDHLEVHQGTDLILFVGQRGTHPLALLGVQGVHELMDDIARQVRGQIGEFVGVELAGHREDFLIVHVGDQRLADGVRDFQ